MNNNNLNQENPLNGFREFIFNNTSAVIINTMLAIAFCLVAWMYLLCITSGTDVGDWLFTMLAYTLFWAVPTVIYNYVRFKSGHKGRIFALTLLIPYAICIVAGGIWLGFGGSFKGGVSVSSAKESIHISEKKLSLKVGNSKKLSLKNVSKKQVKKVTWKSSDKTVATVSNKGLVKAKTVGKANITAKFKKKKYTCKVTVTAKEDPRVKSIPYLGSEDERIKCHYSDKFFSEDSKKYNHELAKCSLATALLSEKTIVPSSEGGQQSDLEFFMEYNGFAGFDVNEDYKVEPGMDSAGVACAFKNICGDSTCIAVLIRSTDYGLEWVSNMNMGDGTTILNHEGYELARRKVSGFVADYIKDKNIEGDITFWVAGQSRGAAIANLMAAWLVGDDAKSSGITVTPDRVFAYCFAPPQAAYVGTGTDIRDLKTGYENIHNMIFDRDIVSRIPPASYGFGVYGVKETGVYGTDEKEVASVLKNLNENAYNAFISAEGKDYGGMSCSEWTDSYANKLAELCVDRKTYTAEWQETFTAGAIMLFAPGTETPLKPDQGKVSQLAQVLLSGGTALYVDHFPQTNYAYIATAK